MIMKFAFNVNLNIYVFVLTSENNKPELINIEKQ